MLHLTLLPIFFRLSLCFLLDSAMYSIASSEIKCHVGTFLAGFLLGPTFDLTGNCIRSDTLTLLVAVHSRIDLSNHVRHGK